MKLGPNLLVRAVFLRISGRGFAGNSLRVTAGVTENAPSGPAPERYRPGRLDPSRLRQTALPDSSRPKTVERKVAGLDYLFKALMEAGGWSDLKSVAR